MMTRRFALAACAVVLTGMLGAASTQAWTSVDRINHLTFSGAVALPGVTLPAGTYTFEAGPLDTDPYLVRVLTRDRQKVLYQGFTIPVARPAGRVPAVMFGEALAGAPMPIRVWYPTRSGIGHQFRY
ncbi:MAG: hypothetical protein HYU37_02150 [Acidobacteria bacterium]|nr:hypothetical protein [Acidobacteriota bacterium]